MCSCSEIDITYHTLKMLWGRRQVVNWRGIPVPPQNEDACYISNMMDGDGTALGWLSAYIRLLRFVVGLGMCRVFHKSHSSDFIT